MPQCLESYHNSGPCLGGAYTRRRTILGTRKQDHTLTTIEFWGSGFRGNFPAEVGECDGQLLVPSNSAGRILAFGGTPQTLNPKP